MYKVRHYTHGGYLGIVGTFTDRTQAQQLANELNMKYDYNHVFCVEDDMEELR